MVFSLPFSGATVTVTGADLLEAKLPQVTVKVKFRVRVRVGVRARVRGDVVGSPQIITAVVSQG